MKDEKSFEGNDEAQGSAIDGIIEEKFAAEIQSENGKEEETESIELDERELNGGNECGDKGYDGEIVGANDVKSKETTEEDEEKYFIGEDNDLENEGEDPDYYDEETDEEYDDSSDEDDSDNGSEEDSDNGSEDDSDNGSEEDSDNGSEEESEDESTEDLPSQLSRPTRSGFSYLFTPSLSAAPASGSTYTPSTPVDLDTVSSSIS